MEVIILGANTLYSVFCFFNALLPEQVWSGMVGKGLKGPPNLSFMQSWYADDTSASGSIRNLHTWWDELVALGPL